MNFQVLLVSPFSSFSQDPLPSFSILAAMVFLLPPCKAGPLSRLPCPPAPLPIHFVHYDQWCENIKASLTPTPPPVILHLILWKYPALPQVHPDPHTLEPSTCETSLPTSPLSPGPTLLQPHQCPGLSSNWPSTAASGLCTWSSVFSDSLFLRCVCVCVWAHAHAHAQSLSCVWFFVTPWTAAHQSPLSMGFSQQEYWSGLPFPPPRDLPQIVKAFSFDIFKVSNTTS